ncbi:MAG: TlyA family RNA methyltransferase [Clostridia bacterium]|nr:TlyA family RNA methyltransferase [Clostridia bacterium]
MRLDLYLVSHGLVDSREGAKRLIEEGLVLVNGTVITKPAKEIVGDPAVTVTPKKYVGRGGEKMEAALSLFCIDPSGLAVLDIGASTGGFTDCLLQNGAKSAVTVDAGIGQLHPKLLADTRVRNIEKYNARYLSATDTGKVDLAVMDVSFISQTYILPQIPAVLNEGGALVSLIKPQFEAGRGALNKQGIVRHERDRIFAVARVLEAARAVGLVPVGLAPSPILGGDGNEEFLAYFKLNATPKGIVDVEKTVKNKAVILLI